ncbi:MAG: amidohydrolase family protein [Beijerinckiaceae bacterium]
MTDFLIKGARGIFTGLPGDEARATGDIRVRGGIITEIGALSPEAGEQIVDASGCVVTPGLVNTHHHLFQSLMKGVTDGLDSNLFRWLRVVPYTYWDKLDEEALRVSAMVGMAELALSGATTIADHHYIFSDSYDFDPADLLFELASKFGVRFVFCRGGATMGRSFDEGRIKPIPTEPLGKMLASVEKSAARWHDASPNSLRRVVLAPTTPTFSLDEGELREMAQMARANGLRMHTHLSETSDYDAWTESKYGMRPIHWIGKHGWLGPDVWFAHLTTMDDSEVRALYETGTGMAHCPQANARLGSGVAPADKLSRLGGNVSLAVDGAAANEAADMASALYAAFTVHRATKGAGAVAADEILRWATAGGAKVLGIDSAGTLEPGKSADITIFDLTNPRYLGQHDCYASPVISGGQAQVRHSFVQGREIVRDGKLPWLDMEQLAADANRIVARMAAQVAA